MSANLRPPFASFMQVSPAATGMALPLIPAPGRYLPTLLHWAFLFPLLCSSPLCIVGRTCNAPAQEKAGSHDEQSWQQRSGSARIERQPLADAVRRAFAKTHKGWSADEVIINDELRREFLAACHEQLRGVSEFDCNWMLLNLRKAGELGVPARRRLTLRHEEYFHAAEMAARYVFDKYKATVDRAMCEPRYRAEFDRVARSVAPDVPAYRLRKAALGLRKARRLRPELVTRVADWGRQVLEFPVDKLAREPSLVPARPGVYIFRDRSGYLYIGESSNLRQRLAKHLAESDRQSLANYLHQHGYKDIVVEVHAFDPDSRAKERMVRRAYESELIRSRKPRFNIAP